MGVNQNLAIAAVNVALTDIRKGMGVGNTTLAELLGEQRRANELAEKQLAAAQATNEHLTYLIRGLLAAGVITQQP